ncbi:MAG: endonuclease Q family protein [Desulfobacterota bacterium]|nr:endonuclease Q family protein [Thermodesulfobacteriota bacterium]
MRFLADLHVHSRYSRATSREMTPEKLWMWAQIKGINVIGTGDFTHPLWLKELTIKLKRAQNGLYTLKEDFRPKDVPPKVKSEPYFMVSGEISTIYKKNGKLRKIHTLILLPTIEHALKVQLALSRMANLDVDGRPVLGLDVKDLLKIVTDICQDAIFIPAHAWTPHFSVFGSESGFDSLRECFEELTNCICAIETGLSSNPPMNWRVSDLDRLTLLSNSDAHSPIRIGREANIFDCELSYDSIREAIVTKRGFVGTCEFFPEEGKYHFDGHRECGVVLSPKETMRLNYLCPRCGEKLTVGVMHRVEVLADREDGKIPEGASSYVSLVPLIEIISEALGVSPSSSVAESEYLKLISSIGNEFYILTEADIDEISKYSFLVAQGVSKVRSGDIKISPGYDGVYGKIRIFDDEKGLEKKRQWTLFD